MIKVGSIVKCINGNFNSCDINSIGESNFPKAGKLYTVAGIKEQHRGVGLLLEEIPKVVIVQYSSFCRPEQISFLASRFQNQLDPVEIQEQVINELINHK